VEVTYSGEVFDRYFERWNATPKLTQAEKELKRAVQEDFFPHLEWMLSLKKLVLLKLGDFWNFEECCTEHSRRVKSLLLNNLFKWLISKSKSLDSLRCLWIQGFHSPKICKSTLFPEGAEDIQSYYVEAENFYFPPDKYSKFAKIQHLGMVDVTSPLGVHLPQLKYVRGLPTNFEVQQYPPSDSENDHSDSEDDDRIRDDPQQYHLQVLLVYILYSPTQILI